MFITKKKHEALLAAAVASERLRTEDAAKHRDMWERAYYSILSRYDGLVTKLTELAERKVMADRLPPGELEQPPSIDAADGEIVKSLREKSK